MQGLYAYLNNKEVNLADVRQKVFDHLIEEPEFYNANPSEKTGFQKLLPVLLDEAFDQELKTEELSENQQWLGKLALQSVKEWHRQNEGIKKQIVQEVHADLERQMPTEIFFWQLFLQLIRGVENQEDRKQNRLLTPESSPEHELKICQHPLIPLLAGGLDVRQIKGKNLKPVDHEEFIRLFQYLFNEIPEYQEYKNAREVDDAAQEEIWKVLYRRLFRSEIFNEIMLERDMHWSENRILLEVGLKKTFKALCAGQVPTFVADTEETEEFKRFFEILFFSSLDHYASDEKEMAAQLKNWDPDRMALLDKYLIHLSLTEMREFPHIPVKVTINEYLEIAKSYSGPGSAGFINGIVDRLSKILKDKGNIKKSARGLMDNK